MKMLINVAETVVADALRGMAAAHPELTVDVENRVVVRRDAPVAGRVALVSGGGSGHEPLHGGFVGPGMLSAACPGEVFTSPVPDQMLRAAAAVDSGAGVLFIVKNYTGDVLNFDMAAELAEDEGIQIAKVLVDDDVAVTDSLYTAGRRGTGATLFVEKIAGAAAEEGQPLERVEAVARQVNENSRSFGVALSACTTPAKGSPTFDLPAGELELGVGIHGEPGRERRAMMTSGEIADFAIHAILDDMTPRNPVLLLVNGMGATPLLELYGFNAEVHRLLAQRGVAVARTLVGNYVTSLDMAGASVTLCQVDEELLRLWDAPVKTAGLRWGCEAGTGTQGHRDTGKGAPTVPTMQGDPVLDADFFRRWMTATAASVDREADRLTALDSPIGDADHGSNLRRGFTAVSAALEKEAPETPGAVLVLAGRQLISTVGGASGPCTAHCCAGPGRPSGTRPRWTRNGSPRRCVPGWTR